MKRSVLEQLKAKAIQRKEKATDADAMITALVPLLSTLKKLLPEEVVSVLEKYKDK